MSSNSDNHLHLDHHNRKLLGVCSGFARYLDVPASLVRLIYCLACLLSPVLIIVYFVMYLCLKKDTSPTKMRVYVSKSRPAEHFRRIDYRKPLYRNTDNRRIAGVCSGIADYLDVSPFIVRLVTFLSLFILGGAVFWAYIVCWIVLDKRPAGFSRAETGDPRQATEEEQSPETRSLGECANQLLRTEARLREVEAFMTSRQFRLHCEINRI